MANATDKGKAKDERDKALGKKQLAQRIDALAAVSEQIELRSSGLQDEIRRLADAQETLADTASRLSGKVEELGAKGESFETTLRQVASIHQDLVVRLQDIEAADEPESPLIEELRSGIARLLAEEERQNARATDLQERLNGLESQLADADQRHGELSRRLETLGTDSGTLDTLERALQQVRLDLETATQRLAGLETANDADTALMGLETRLDAMEAGLDNMQRQSREGLDLMDQRLGKAGREMQELQSRYGDMAEESRRVAEGLVRLERESAEGGGYLEQLEALAGRLSGLQEQIEPLAREQATHKKEIQELGSLGETLQQGHEDLGRRFAEALHNLGVLQDRADTLGEQVQGLEGAARDLEDLRRSNEELQEFRVEQQSDREELLGRLEMLGQAVHETTELIGQEASRVATLQQRVEADGGRLESVATAQAQHRDQLQALTERLDELSGLWVSDDENSREALEQLQNQLADLGTRLHSLGERSKASGERLERTDQALRSLSERTESVAGRLDGFDQVPERIRELESLTGPLTGRLDNQDESFVQLQSQLDQLEQSTNDLAGRVAEEAERIAGQEERSDTEQERLSVLAAEVEQNGVDLSSLVGRLETVQASGGELQEGLRQLSERAGRLAEQDRHLERSLEAVKEKFQAIGSTLDSTGSSLDAVQRENRKMDERMGELGSGLRVLAWSGAVAAALLLTLSVLVYVFAEQGQQGALQSVEQRLDALEQGGGAADLPGPGDTTAVTEQLDDLRRQVGALGTRLDNLPAQGDPGGNSELAAVVETVSVQQTNLVQGMDEMNERIAELEERAQQAASAAAAAKAAASAEAPLKVAKPNPAKPPPAPTVAAEPWAEARKRGAFTVQLLGVRTRDSLRVYAERHGIASGSAIIQGQLDGKPWFVLVHGIQDTSNAGKAAARQLRDKIPGSKPWVRPIPKSGVIEPL
jgi:chromosome segregation ATPase